MELLTTKEAAAYARKHEDTLLTAARQGEVQSLQRVPHGPRLYRREWLDSWLAGEPPKRSALPRNSGRPRLSPASFPRSA